MSVSFISRKISDHRRRGVALVLTLAFITIVSILLVAFVGQSMLDRSTSQNYAQSAKAQEIAASALEVVLDDLRQEIADPIHSDKSAQTYVSNNNIMTVYTPKDGYAGPERVNAPGTPPSLIRQSTSGTLPFTGYAGRNLASASNSATPSANLRSIVLDRWNSHYLLGATISANLKAPDWVILTRDGPDSTAAIADLRNPAPANMHYALGRYAYSIYNEGGLLDASVAGAITGNGSPIAGYGPVPTDQIAKKGSPGLANLAVLPGAINPNPFVQWRNSLTAQDNVFADGVQYKNPSPTAPSYLKYLFDPLLSQGFLKVYKDDRRILSRQDLIGYVKSHPDQFATDVLPYLGTFSADRNMPNWRPAQDLAGYPYKTNADNAAAVNRNLMNVRVNVPFTRPDGTAAAAGEPLLKQRFSLRRLDALAPTATDSGSGNVYPYFGLQRSDPAQPWIYHHGASDRILTLDEVAKQGREPDFFELLQAAILNGSLGKTGGRTLADTDAADSNSYFQVIRIGANIIDQYDNDSIPSAITFFGCTFYGLENLPYLNEVFLKYYVDPLDTATVVKPFLIFELWNPHDPTLTGRSSLAPTQFRIRPVSGVISLNGGGVPDSQKPLVLNTQTFISDPTAPGAKTLEFDLASGANYVQPRVPDSPANADLGYAAMPIGKYSYFDKNYYYGWYWMNIESSLMVLLEYKDPAANVWRTYSTLAGLQETPSGLRFASTEAPGWTNEPGTTGPGLPMPFTYFYDGERKEDIFSKLPGIHSIVKSDPRTDRFGCSFSSRKRAYGPDGANADHDLDGKSNASLRPSQAAGQGFISLYSNPNWNTSPLPRPALMAQNNVAGQLYTDRDGAARRADGAVVSSDPVNPMEANAGTADGASRPVILNRPFRSVGELGYAFRDEPWKTLDFATAESADAALLEVFTTDDSALSAGRVDLNTQNAPVLEALLSGSGKTEAGTAPLSDADCKTIAAKIVQLTSASGRQLTNRSQLIGKVLPAITLGDTTANKVKTQRESIVRALADTTTARTWNLLIDVVAQAGRYPQNATSLDRFTVEGERRYWLHVAIDRYTGEVIRRQLELVYE